MRKNAFWTAVFVLVGLSSAPLHAYEYIMSDRTLSWNFGFITATTQITSLTSGDWDEGYFDLSLPSNNQFYFYGKKVTHVRIMTNGYVAFGFGGPPSAGCVSLNASLPAPDPPNSIAAPFWDDFNITSGGLYYTLGGSYAVIEWRDVPLAGAPGATYTFEIILHAHGHGACPDVILFVYDDVVAGDAAHDYGALAAVGIEHYAGTQGEEYAFHEARLQNNGYVWFMPFVPVYALTTGIWGGAAYPVLTVFRPSDGTWYFRKADDSTGSVQFGTRGDIPLPGDYDGNGTADVCVLRPTDYLWYCSAPAFTVQWGDNGDIPVPADYDNAGVTDIAVFRETNWNGNAEGTWFIYHQHNMTTEAIKWGTYGDVPVPADYDYDNIADLAVYRPSNNTWYIRKSSDPGNPWIVTWGTEGDVPMATYGLTGYADIIVFRPSTGQWFSNNLAYPLTWTDQWGTEGDEPVPCTEKKGTTEYVVFRPGAGLWYIWSTGGWSNYPGSVSWGMLGDKPRFR